MFPRLRVLDVAQTVLPEWLEGLGDLQQLETLGVSIESFWLSPDAPEPVQLPLLAHLTSLEIAIGVGTIIQMEMAKLPVLSRLTLEGQECRVALTACPPAHQLRPLTCRMEHLSADFAALPGLRSAHFDARLQLDQPASIAGATALACLGIRGWRSSGDQRAALQLLQSLPPGVSCVCLTGAWPAEVATLLAKLPRLAALELYWRGNGEPPLPPAVAPLWSSLRALSWRFDAKEGLGLPQALRQASVLETLHIGAFSMRGADLNQVSCFPALRRMKLLQLDSDDYGAGSAAADARAITRLRRVVPHVDVWASDKWLQIEELVDWALGRNIRALFE
ncbi:hypothetical protein N2152v2_000949 [Parachlorella kessleri]